MNNFPVNYLACFINLFIVPIFSLIFAAYFYKKPYGCNFSTFIRYFVYVVSNLVIAHVFVVFVRVIFGVRVANDGVTYTIFVLISCAISVWAEVFVKKFIEESKNQQTQEGEK